MDLQAASIGIDLNDENLHDGEEAEDPLDHGMKAISGNNATDLNGARPDEI